MTINDAVDKILRRCGLRASGGASNSRNGDLAQETLTEANLSIQALGWPENTEDRVKLTRDGSNEYPTAAVMVGLDSGYSLISVRSTGGSIDLTIHYRNGKLWWRDDSVSTGTPWKTAFDNNGLEVTRVFLVTFTHLPEHLADLVVSEAAKRLWPLVRHQIDNARFETQIALRIEEQWFRDRSSAMSIGDVKDRNNLLTTAHAQRIRGRRRMFDYGVNT
jgi:hypothetical protein